MNPEKLQNNLNLFWDEEIVPTLEKYIKIPNKSPAFDPNWESAGHMDKVLKLAEEWVEQHVSPIKHIDDEDINEGIDETFEFDGDDDEIDINDNKLILKKN